ncbi:MAG: hypothetical protein IJI14_20770 [Anaerolineaceae bacterium]|nr:hypothetical protein [Anaerolineaceae bacterium]
MSITKSYNNRTKTYYAYETSYEWDEEKQKKIQRKRCIGQFDPKTGEVIPNGRVGRPSTYAIKGSYRNNTGKDESNDNTNSEDLQKRTIEIERRLLELAEEANDLGIELKELADSIRFGS